MLLGIIQNIKESNLQNQMVDWWLLGSERLGNGEILVEGYKVSVMK